MRSSGLARIGVAVLLGAAIAAVISVALAQPAGLSSRPVASVPALLSEPAGVPGADLVLAPDGLGPVTFGEVEETAVARLTELLGAPVEDGPQPCDSEDDVVRWVRWGNLTAAFPNGQFGGYISGIYFRQDSPELPIETAEGVGLRATVEQLTATYGDRLAWHAQEESGFEDPVEAFGIDGFNVDDPTPTGLGGYVEGGREHGQVITFFAGQPCGPQ
jgi:hypothetical protein